MSKQKIKTTTPLQKELYHQTDMALRHTKEKKGNLLQKLFQKTKSKPWVLLIGKSGSGKTSLLQKSQHVFSSPFKKSIDNMGKTQSIDWWVSKDAVFIDPAGKYAFSSANETKHYQYWKDFLSFLKKKYKNPFDSITCVIDLPTLMHHDEISFDDFLERWREQLQLLAHYCDPLCINLVITHCDVLSGYAEFFAQLDTKQQQEIFGFSLLDSGYTTHRRDLFVERFHDFIGIVNQRTLDRLHKEPNHERRLRIHDFPMQLEKLEKPLKAILDSIPDSNTIFLNHIFFCNNFQTTHTLHWLRHDFNKAFPLKTSHEMPLVPEERTLFTHDLISELSQPHIVKIPQKKTPTHARWSFVSYPVAIILAIIFTAVYHDSYRYNVSAINAIASSMTPSHQELTELSKLNQLKKAQDSIKKYTLKNHYLFGFNQAYQLDQEIQYQYTFHLNHSFVAYLNKIITDKIKQDNTTHSSELYNSLSVYLTMDQHEVRENDFIQHWFHRVWAMKFPHRPDMQKNLDQHLKTLLENSSFVWKKDNNLIQAAKETLQKQPLAETAYQMLCNQNSQRRVTLKNDVTIDGIDLSKASISEFYSDQKAETIYKASIPDLVQRIFKGKSLLENRQNSNLTSKELTEQLRLMYVRNYLKHWNESMKRISFQEPTSFQQAVEQIHLITNPHSPLWQMYQDAVMAIRTAGGAEELHKIILEEDTPNLTNYMPTSEKSADLMQTLHALQIYLQQINDAPSSTKAAFDASTQRYLETDATKDIIEKTLIAAKSTPTPLKQWVRQLTHNDWKFMLAGSKAYLNTLWQTTVVSVYKKTIADRFPIFKDSKEDISVEDFNQFFGPGGIIQTYFNSYLKPFVDMSQPYWVWKSLNGEKINISSENLDMLLRASVIQQMFYTDTPDRPSLGFTLTPVDLSGGARQFTLNVGGQMVRYTTDVKEISVLEWPGTDGEFVTLRFVDTAENDPTLTTMGPWAWLRLLNLSTLEPNTDNPRQFQVTFKINNEQAVYQLIANNPINPYIPNILSAFRCPEKL